MAKKRPMTSITAQITSAMMTPHSMLYFAFFTSPEI